MYQKQNTNDFIAFKCLFNEKLVKAVKNSDIKQIKEILNTTYDNETENNFYISVPIDIQEIRKQYNEHIQELENDPSLIYKL